MYRALESRDAAQLCFLEDLSKLTADRGPVSSVSDHSRTIGMGPLQGGDMVIYLVLQYKPDGSV